MAAVLLEGGYTMSNVVDRVIVVLSVMLVLFVGSVIFAMTHPADFVMTLQILGLLIAGIISYVIYHKIELAKEVRKERRALRLQADAEAARQRAIAEQERQKALIVGHQASLTKMEVDMRSFFMQAAAFAQQQGGSYKFTQQGFEVINPTRVIESSPVQQQAQIAPVATPVQLSPVLPPPYDLLNIFRHSEVALDNIFLGMSETGEPLYVDGAKALCHGVFNAVTGRGKTIIERGIEAQLLAVNAEVFHLDLKFSLIDENGLDYRPIAQRLMDYEMVMIGEQHVPHLITDMNMIYAMIQWLALREIPRRLEMYRNGNHSYSVLYVFLEELLYLVKKFPDLGTYIEDVIVVGRSLGIKLFTAAQNFQSQNTNISGGMRENFETAYYLGGDDYSGAKMLDVKQKELTDYLGKNNITLGKGVAMLRNNAIVPQARLVRTGMASNDAIYYLLGRADDFTLSGVRGNTSGTYGNPVSMPSQSIPDVFPTSDVTVLERRNYGYREPVTGTLQTPSKSPVEPVGTTPHTFLPSNDELVMSEKQVELFKAIYPVIGNIVESLKKIENGKGQGLGKRYFAHASWLVKHYGLRK